MEDKWLKQFKQVADKPQHYESVGEKLDANAYTLEIHEQNKRIANAFEDFATDGVYDHLFDQIRMSIVNLEQSLPENLPVSIETAIDDFYATLSKNINAHQDSFTPVQNTNITELARSFLETTRAYTYADRREDIEGAQEQQNEQHRMEGLLWERFDRSMNLLNTQIERSFEEHEQQSAHNPDHLLMQHLRRITQSIAYEWEHLPQGSDMQSSELKNKCYDSYQRTINNLQQHIKQLEVRGDVSPETMTELKKIFDFVYIPPYRISDNRNNPPLSE